MTGSIVEGDWIEWPEAGRVYRGQVEQKLYGFYYVRLEDGKHARADVRAATKTDPPAGRS